MRSMGSMQHVPPDPLRFDSYDPEWDLGQSSRHLNLCFLLRELLLRAVTRNDTVGMDAFTFFDENDARKKCAPDAFVKLGVPYASFESWQTWHQGAPELCVEILSPSDTKEKLTQDDKLAAFEAMGVREVVFFDVDAPEGSRLRAWDRVGTKLVSRSVTNERTPVKTLGRWFHVGPIANEPIALFIADETGVDRILSNDEARIVAEEGRRLFEAKWIAAEASRRAAEESRRAAEAARTVEAEARAMAEARVRELEELLRSKA
ncbi:hypothetical protein BH09MYX1_BH09MYX1_02210 [soil metagenome]